MKRKPMSYISTRGATPAMGFSDAVMTGLAPDSGLLVPSAIPDASGFLPRWRELSYGELAYEVISLYSDLPEVVLRNLIDESYKAFLHPDVVPLRKADGFYLAELFHGPTLAFKDIALQFLGRLFDYILEQRGGELNILAATSGDTGSAAISGVRGRPRISIFVMFPEGRISPLQERQMTTVADDNVHCIAVRGTFDDCQRLMKQLFADKDFNLKYHLGSVNSVNWARVLVQMVYYFYAAFRVMECSGAGEVQFAVPTGNFGDLLAGYYARRMGLPIRHLILATNENNILSRFFSDGVYSRGPVIHTLSPAMDIQIASNFERYLYYRCSENPDEVAGKMAEFSEKGSLRVPLSQGVLDPLIKAGEVSNDQTIATMRDIHEKQGLILDPHTAVGVRAGLNLCASDIPLICLATAHPAKFNEAVRRAIGRDISHPVLEPLRNLPTRRAVIDGETGELKAFIESQLWNEGD